MCIKIHIKQISLSFLALLFIACNSPQLHLTTIKANNIPITDSLSPNKAIESFIKPYRDKINADLDGVISYSKQEYSKNDGELNTALGNLFADAVYALSNPVFKSRTNELIDVVLLNHGGIRSVLPKGNITARTAYSLMPFENSVVVVKVKGENINKMVDYLVKQKRAHPLYGLQIIVDANYNLIEAKINNAEIDPNKVYNVATNDYLFNGGDNMSFFKPNEGSISIDYRIRNLLIDYFKQVDTINPVRDKRFIKQ